MGQPVNEMLIHSEAIVVVLCWYAIAQQVVYA